MSSRAGLSILALLFPASASAHLVTTGLGPFYDGISHLLLSPDDLLGVIGLALLAGLRGKAPGRHVLFVLPAAWIAGGLLGLLRSSELLAPAASAVSFLVIGILVAADVHLKPAFLLAVTILFGVFHGYLNGTLASEAGLGFGGLVGIAATVFVLVSLLASLAVSLRDGWQRIVARVAGSWIAAIGLLMVGWALRP